ncbi:MAG: AMP-binding protein [Clostridia bacterium]|nr:AMP-binding protein [Clostridia bacterium]
MIEKFCRTDFKSYEEFYSEFTINKPPRFNFVYDVIDEWAAQQPDKTAMVWCDEHGDEEIITFAMLKERSERFANFFYSKGIRKGDTVMLVLKRRREYWYSMLALHRIGAVAIPATFLLTEKDIEYRCDSAGIKMIVCVNEQPLVGAIEKSFPKCRTLQNVVLVGKGSIPEGFSSVEEAFAMPAGFEKPTGDAYACAEDPLLIYFTSGTTGMPKMVLHNHYYPLGHILTAKFWHNLDENSLHITVADTGWAKASWGKLYGQWICGAALFVYDMEKFEPLPLMQMVAKYHVTSFCAPPTIYRFAIKEDLSGIDFSHLRYATTAGEPLNGEVFNRFKQLTGIEIHEGFGQTESPVLIATYPWIKPVPGSLGKPSPLFGIKLLDEDGNEVEPGDEGEICIDISKGLPPGLFQGYKGDDKKNAEAMHDGWYHTGDKAWMNEKGYLFFIGRGDDVIKSSGYRIGPFEVESALLTHPSVVECAISAVPDPTRGQIVKATIVLARGYTASDALKKELQDHVKHVTAPYKYPRIVEFVDELPKTSSGKIKRNELRERDKDKRAEQ